jgi:hypothetical protein
MRIVPPLWLCAEARFAVSMTGFIHSHILSGWKGDAPHASPLPQTFYPPPGSSQHICSPVSGRGSQGYERVAGLRRAREQRRCPPTVCAIELDWTRWLPEKGSPRRPPSSIFNPPSSILPPPSSIFNPPSLVLGPAHGVGPRRAPESSSLLSKKLSKLVAEFSAEGFGKELGRKRGLRLGKEPDK